jgi:hypothetical protein
VFRQNARQRCWQTLVCVRPGAGSIQTLLVLGSDAAVDQFRRVGASLPRHREATALCRIFMEPTPYFLFLLTSAW